MRLNRKAIARSTLLGLIAGLVTLALVLWLSYTWLGERAPGEVEKVGFSKVGDDDQDDIANFLDMCCPAVCNPAGPEWSNKPISYSADYYGCTEDQAPTPCGFTGPQCNRRVAPGTPVAGTPAPTG